MANGIDALLNIHHTILVNIALCVQCSEVLHDSIGTILFTNEEKRAVIPTASGANYSKLQPFLYFLFDVMFVLFGDFELFDIYRFGRLQNYLVVKQVRATEFLFS